MTLAPAGSRQGFLVCVVFVIERAGRILLLKRSRAKDRAPAPGGLPRAGARKRYRGSPSSRAA